MKMVKTKLALGAAVAALALSAGSANAAISFTSEAYDEGAGPAGTGPNENMVLDFDTVNLGTYDGDVGSATNSGVAEKPPGNQGDFGYITANGSPVLYTLPYLAKTLSIYIGSIDSYNTLNFLDKNGDTVVSYTGNALTSPANGNPTGDLQNRRFYFDFDGAAVAKVQFVTTQNSFEFDNVAISAVPEPGMWALMIAGFGMLGGALRRRRATMLATA